jgi:prephenate dehydrogenase
MNSDSPCIAVFGPGLMGGSLLLALRERLPAARTAIWARRDEAVQAVVAQGLAASGSTNAEEVAQSADAIVLCVPVEQMASLAAQIAGAVSPDTLVTDVGSTKEEVVCTLENIFQEHRNFVGSHPMCGSEAAGLEAARADLYQDAMCAVTTTTATRADLADRAEDLWKIVGARTLRLSPEEHDAAVAASSHVPHLAAAALVELIGDSAASRALCARGMRDTTRIAAGSPELWTGILSQNRIEVARALARLTHLLDEAREALERGDMSNITTLLAAARAHRAEIFPK